MRRLLCSIVLVAFAVRAQTTPEPPPPDDEAPPVRRMVQPPSSTWGARLHLSSPQNSPLVLRREGEHGEVVCTAPCGELVQFRPSDPFVLTGPGITPSEPFRLKANNGDLQIRAEPSMEAARTAGKTLIVVGVAGGIIGGYAPLLACGGSRGNSDWCYGNGPLIVALSTAAIGGALALLGVGLLAAHSPTRVTVSE
jgi:hypothetical protein